MPSDFGLSAMTGVLPTVLVAGVATGMATQLMPGERRRRRGSRRRQPSVFGPPPRARGRGRAKKGNVFDMII